VYLPQREDDGREHAPASLWSILGATGDVEKVSKVHVVRGTKTRVLSAKSGSLTNQLTDWSHPIKKLENCPSVAPEIVNDNEGGHMKRGRFSEEQIVGIMKRRRAGQEDFQSCAEAWDQRGDANALYMEE
jgi:hypothetical protein